MAAKKRTIRKAPVILPKVPSELIDIALKDIRKALAKGWVINMGNWYEPKATVNCTIDDSLIIDSYTVCSACAAGAVMAMSLASKSQLKRSLEPDKFNKNTAQLRAIDDLRQGNARAAVSELGLVNLYGNDDATQYNIIAKLDTNIPDFDQKKPEPFFKAMKAFSAKLKKAGY